MAKKRIFRWVLIAGVIVVLLLAVTFAALLNSGVQTAFILGKLRAVDPQAKLERASLGFSSGELDGLEVREALGVPVKLPQVSVQYSLWNLIFNKTKIIEKAEVKGLVIDAATYLQNKAGAPKAPAASPSPSSGNGEVASIFVLIKEADIDATVLLSNQRTITVTYNAHDLGAGGSGTATGQWVFKDNSPDASVKEMHATTQLQLTCDASMVPQLVDLAVDFSATMPGQAQPSQLQAHLQAKPQNADSGQLSLTLTQPGATATQLLEIKSTYSLQGSLQGEFTAALDRARVEPFAFGTKLPDFSLKGQGQFAVDATTASGSLKGSLSGSAGNLSVVRPELAAMGSVDAQVTADLAWSKNKWEGHGLSVSLAPTGGKPVVTLDLLKPVTAGLDAAGNAKLTDGAGPELVRLTLAQMPAAWLAGVMPAGYAVTGPGLSTQVVIGTGDNNAIVAKTNQPLALASLRVQKDGQDLVTGGNVTLDASAQYLDGRMTAEVRQLFFEAEELQVGNVSLNTALPRAGVVRAQFAGNVTVTPATEKTADAPAASAQIAANGRLALGMDLEKMDSKTFDPKIFGPSWLNKLPAGTLTLDGNFSINQANGNLEVSALSFGLKKGSTAMATVTLLQKITMPTSLDAKLPAVAGDLASVEANGLPLALLQPFLPAGMILTGDPLKGKIVFGGAGATEAGFVLRTDQPLTVTKLHYANGADSKLTSVTLTIAPQGTWKTGEMKASVHILANASAGVLLDGTLNASQTGTKQAVSFTANGKLGALAAQPLGDDWRDFLPDPKPQYTIDVSASTDGKTATLETANLRVVPAGGVGTALADIKLLQAVGMTLPAATPANAENKKPEAASMAWPHVKGDVLSLKLADLPAGVLDLALPGYQLEGKGISGDVVVSGAGDGNYTLTTNSPVTATGFSVTSAPDKEAPVPWIKNLTFAMSPQVKFGAAGLSSCTVPDLTLTSGNSALVKGSLEYVGQPGQSWPPAQMKTNLQGDLAQLLQQPILKPFNNLTAGQVALVGELDGQGNIKLNLDATNWHLRSPDVGAPKISFSNITGKIDQATGAMQFSIPLKGQGTLGPTDCTLTVSLGANGPEGAARKFDVGLTGSSLVVDDVMMMQKAFQPPAPDESLTTTPPTTTPLSPPTPVAGKTPAKPVALWSGWQGQANVDVKHLVYQTYALDNLKISAQVTPTQIALPTGSMQFQGAPISVTGNLDFDPAQARQPYSLQTKLSLANFDAKKYLLSVNPQSTPAVEGKFSIDGTLSGRGPSLESPADWVQFNLKLTSSSGTFHVLPASLESDNQLAQGGAQVASLALSLLGKKSQATTVDQSSAAFNSIVTYLKSINYNQLVLATQRGADLNINITQFNVQNPEINLTGSGKIAYDPKKSIVNQSLTANLQLSAKGAPLQSLENLHVMTGGKPDAAGYTPGPQFPLTGTLGDPNFQGLSDLLKKAALNTGGNLLNQVLGGK